MRLAYIRPGRPVENCFIERFDGRIRDERLHAHHFDSLTEARRIIDARSEQYYTARPHSGIGNRTPAELAAQFTLEEGQSSSTDSDGTVASVGRRVTRIHTLGCAVDHDTRPGQQRPEIASRLETGRAERYDGLRRRPTCTRQSAATSAIPASSMSGWVRTALATRCPITLKPFTATRTFIRPPRARLRSSRAPLGPREVPPTRRSDAR